MERLDVLDKWFEELRKKKEDAFNKVLKLQEEIDKLKKKNSFLNDHISHVDNLIHLSIKLINYLNTLHNENNSEILKKVDAVNYVKNLLDKRRETLLAKSKLLREKIDFLEQELDTARDELKDLSNLNSYIFTLKHSLSELESEYLKDE